MAATLQPGLIALHGNRTETLAETVFSWLRAHPLAPLEQEVVLVQSNGMAEWFKMGMAEALGVCAAARVELPARFLWRSYRQVLGAAAVPRQSPLDKTALTWRLMRQLPECAAQGGYEAIAGFLAPGDAERLLQLSERLADLFDQYQIYRADWLDDWAAERDVLATPGKPALPVPEEQLWQPKLWRCILAGLSEAERATTRPELHRQVIAALESGAPLARPIARRVVLFGMSHLPLSMLQTLSAMARHSQILLAVPNPCRFHWADAIDGRELLRMQRRRQPLKGGRDLAALPLDMMHAHAHPLLSSWGRQARDYVRQLDAFETVLPEGAAAELPRIDIFDEDVDPEAPLLSQVQQAIRDMVPLTEHAHSAVPRSDRSIVFHCAHSMVRELEVLHDQLLELLAQPAPPDGRALQPRDVVVMVPAIEGVAASIRAVFGQYGRFDARHIPFDIADLSASDNNPLVAALQWLLRLPRQRCRLSELRDLLDVPAVAARFGLQAEDLPQLSAWMAGAGIRWGLNAEQRGALGLEACGEQNSAWFGLHRMLLGFASGSGAVDGSEGDDAAGLARIEPYTEVGGLGAELAGQLATLLERLLAWWALASDACDPRCWAQRFRQLLADFFAAETDSDRALLAALDGALSTWLEACALGGFDDKVELVVAQQAWLDIVQQPSVDSRFRAGGVTFCTLMPMRAIPFEVVCLLGMNDGDYPRRALRSDFDLMALPGQLRAGDRARRDDDRQLMLEALLSARRMLYISWAGRSVRDNSEQPPSVLVSQLRDYLAAGWTGDDGAQDSLLAQRSFQHPLQPFSRRYFTPDSPLRTYAREWRAAHLLRDQATAVPALAPFVPDVEVPLTLAQLQRFVRHPAQAFFRQRLNVRFDRDAELNFDEEAFGLQGLAGYGVIEQLQTRIVADIEAAPGEGIELEQRVAGHLARIERAGTLPLAGLGTRKRAELQETVLPSLQSWLAHRHLFDRPVQRQRLHFAQDGLVLEDWLDDLRVPDRDGEAVPVWLELQARALLDNRKQVRPASVLQPYLRSLVAAACGVAVQGIVVARDATLVLRPMPPGEALAQLQTLLQVWQSGQDSPLPLPLKTALAAAAAAGAAAGEDLARVEAVYEGDGFADAGEVADACWARIYPDFEALLADGRFAPLAEAVHAPLLAWLAEHVSILEPGALAPVVYLSSLEQA